MSSERSSGTLKAPRNPVADAGSIISFDPERVIQGLIFHLLDDKYAERVSDASIRNARERMKKKDLRLAIARRTWEALSHRERFEWLLARSRTQVVYSGRTAILSADR